MSQANREGKQNARERVAAEKLKQRKAARRRKQWTVSGVVVGVVAVSAAVAVLINTASHNSGVFASPVGAVVNPVSKSTQPLGISVGSLDAPVKMTVFEDFRCPICQQDEAAIESTYKQYIADGKLQVVYHPVHLIDLKDGGSGSLNGGNAAACAQDQGQFIPLHDLMYANQPSETTDGFADKKTILQLAAKIPSLKSNTTFLSCVNDGKHNTWVNKNHDAFNSIGAQGTPTFYIGDKVFEMQRPTPTAQDSADTTGAVYTQKVMASYQQQIKTALDKAYTAAGAKPGTPFVVPTVPATPTGSPSATGSTTPSGTPSTTPSTTPSSPSPSGTTPSSTKS
jgi:protein-disulfide isomerase